MNAKRIFRFMAIALMAFPLFTSCSKDEEETSTPAAEVVSGTYTGDVYMALSDTTYKDVTITISRKGDQEVAISSDFSSLEIKGLNVSENNGVYTFTKGANFFEKITMSMGGKPGSEYSSDNSTGKQLNDAEAEGAVTNKKLVFTFGGKPGAMPMAVSYAFEGNKK